MFKFRFVDCQHEYLNDYGRYVVIYDEIADKERIWVGKPNDARDRALGVAQCALYNTTPCECGACKLGIKDFYTGHSDWCPKYRHPLLDWSYYN